MNEQSANAQGRVRFTVDFSGQPRPEVGTYQIVAFANQYQQNQTDPFEVAEGENRNVGRVLLQPNPVLFSNTVPCDDLPPEGGRCRYSVTVTNRMATRLNGQAWSLVVGFGIGSFTDFTNFQVKHRKSLRLKSGRAKTYGLTFKFRAKFVTVPLSAPTCLSVSVRMLFSRCGIYRPVLLFQGNHRILSHVTEKGPANVPTVERE